MPTVVIVTDSRDAAKLVAALLPRESVRLLIEDDDPGRAADRLKDWALWNGRPSRRSPATDEELMTLALPLVVLPLLGGMSVTGEPQVCECGSGERAKAEAKADDDFGAEWFVDVGGSD